jgi:hypothetical protein
LCSLILSFVLLFLFFKQLSTRASPQHLRKKVEWLDLEK